MVPRMAEQDARYLLVADALRHRIENEAPDSLLPPELALARQFGVSRVTIRRALGLLERAGLVSRERGRGTTVSPPKITRRISEYSFEDDLDQRGIKFETRVVEYRPREIAPPLVAETLGLPETTRVGFLSLIRVVDNRVVCHDRRYFPPAIAERFDGSRLEQHTLPGVLEELAGGPITTVDWETEIVPAAREVARSLGITPGLLVLVNRGVEAGADGVPVQVVLMHYRIDRVKFRFKANRMPVPTRGGAPAPATAVPDRPDGDRAAGAR